jgi:CRISPR-associated protein Csb1
MAFALPALVSSHTNLTIELKPLTDSVFPAIFKDVGHSLWINPVTGKQDLLIDSPNSLANRLESVLSISNTGKPIDLLEGISYCYLKDVTGKTIVTTLQLPHRIGSGPIALTKQDDFKKRLQADIKENGLHAAVLRYDTLSLIFGTWLSRIDGGHGKISKVITARIVGRNVTRVNVGGTKQEASPIKAMGISSANVDVSAFEGNNIKGSDIGIGTLPFQKYEFVAAKYELQISINWNLIDAYDLPEHCKAMLRSIVSLCVYELLSQQLYCRTNCSFIPDGKFDCTGLDLPSSKEVLAALPGQIKACKDDMAGATGITTDLKIDPKKADKSDDNA